MKELFQQVPLRKQSILQRLFDQLPEENAIIEVNNLLATRPLASIAINDMAALTSRYGFNPCTVFRKNCFEFYATVLTYLLRNKKLTVEDQVSLDHLARLLQLSRKETEFLHRKIAGPVFEKGVRKAIRGGRLEDADKALLDELQKDLRLSDEDTKELYKKVTGGYVTKFLEDIAKRERFSPEEEIELEAMSRSLMINLTIEKETKKRLNKFKQYWQIAHAPLVPVETSINLQKGETCYLLRKVDWYEQRTVTRRINYGGPSARIKIMKGLYYKVGSYNVERVTSEEWKLIDSGWVYLTNKRIIFTGQKKNTNIRYSKILSFTPYADGVEISKEAGRNPLLGFKNDVDVFCMMLSRVMKEC